MTEPDKSEHVSPLMLNQRLIVIIKREAINEVANGLPNSVIALQQAENVVSIASRSILYKVPRRIFEDERAQNIARELETLFGFAYHLTNTGRQVITGDILEYLFGPGLPDEHNPDKRIPIPGYIADLVKSEEGGLFNKEKAPELEAGAYRSLKRNSDIATRWVNPFKFLQPLGYEIKDMLDVVEHWESELIKKHGVIPQ